MEMPRDIEIETDVTSQIGSEQSVTSLISGYMALLHIEKKLSAMSPFLTVLRSSVLIDGVYSTATKSSSKQSEL